MAFDPIQYIASYQDLIGAFGANAAAGLQHYNQFGQFEGRQQDLFSERQYLTNYRDLQLAFGNNTNAATVHYINFGSREGRTDDAPLPRNFDGLQYIASHDDLIDAFGANPAAGSSHYTQFGRAEGREIDDFNEQQYLANYPDLANAFGGNGGAATLHYILFGQDEGRNDDVPGNNPPNAVDDSVEIAANGARTRVNVLTNDSDPDASDRLTVVAVDDLGAQGSIELSSNGRVFYDPDGAFDDVLIGQTANDTFRYTIADSAGAQSTATVTVSIAGVAELPNGAPTFTSADTATVTENTASVVSLLATDPDGDPVTFTISGGADQTLFAIEAGNQLQFLSAPDFESPADANKDNIYLVQVTANDGAGGTRAQDITITVSNDPNDDPASTDLVISDFLL